MTVKKWLVLVSIAVINTAAYAQVSVPTLERGLDVLVTRQVSRKDLPKLRDGLHNKFTRTLLGEVRPARPVLGISNTVVAQPLRPVLHFADPYKVFEPQVRIEELPRIVGGRHDQRKGEFYEAAAFGSGDIAPIALTAHALIKRALIADGAPLEERQALLDMAAVLDRGFELTPAGEWRLTRATDFAQVHQKIATLRTNWLPYSQAYTGVEKPLSKGVLATLNVIELQTWMLENEGRFPQIAAQGNEGLVRAYFENLINQMANNAEAAADVAMQSAVQHAVHLRAAAKDSPFPYRVILSVLEWTQKGGRVPGSSSVRVSPEENELIAELNYLEQLRRANLLFLILPSERGQHRVEFYLREFQKNGWLYQKMLEVIPEFAKDGVTLNVPSRSASSWQEALFKWKKAHANKTPRAIIAGRFGLPINFNDLTPAEKEEVLLGTYLQIK